MTVQSCGFAVVIPLMLTGLGCTQQRSRALPHEPTKPHTARAFLIDTSRSVDKEQFVKMVNAFEDIVLKETRYNDALWLMRAESPESSAQSFFMPLGNPYRSGRTAAANGIAAEKTRLLSKLGGFKQVSMRTDLCSSLKTALVILQQQKLATRRVLVIGSDFLQDVNGRGGTPAPIDLPDGFSAEGIDVELIVAKPVQAELDKLQISAPDLFVRIERGWRRSLEGHSAATVTVRLLDGLTSPPILADGTLPSGSKEVEVQTDAKGAKE